MTSPGGDSLDLNVGGAEGDLAAINTQLGIMDTAANDLKTASTHLFNGALLGNGADAGTDFTNRLDSALGAAHAVVQQVNNAVGHTSAETVAFDKGGFAGNYSG
jgi:hypothetical protein